MVASVQFRETIAFRDSFVCGEVGGCQYTGNDARRTQWVYWGVWSHGKL